MLCCSLCSHLSSGSMRVVVSYSPHHWITQVVRGVGFEPTKCAPSAQHLGLWTIWLPAVGTYEAIYPFGYLQFHYEDHSIAETPEPKRQPEEILQARCSDSKCRYRTIELV